MIRKYFQNRKIRRRFPKVKFSMNCYIEFIENLSFTGISYVGPNAFWSAKGKIEIGNNVIFGPHTRLWSSSHNYHDSNFIPYGREDIRGEIIIEDNVWIGMGATILGNVRIGEGAVIGAKAVVAKDVPKGAVVVGNPAKIIKYRDLEIYEKLKARKRLYLEFKNRK